MAEDNSEDFADKEYGTFQAHMSNLLMMGTLIFGFCVTGTFLSVTFTGEEPFLEVEHLSQFVLAGLKATAMSLGATILAFIVSTRAANRYMALGALPALRTIYKTIIFAGAAEVMIYLSLQQFLRSVQQYSAMNYMGPELCPMREPDQDATTWSNSSFCGQLGDDLYSAAKDSCSPARAVSWNDEVCTAVNRKKADSQPFAMCSIFDCYTDGEIKIRSSTAWFGWDNQDAGRGYDGLQAMDPYMNPTESYNRVAQQASEAACEKGKASSLKDTACTLGATPTTAQLQACAQARQAYLSADDCAGAKQDDVVKCRKVCQWVHEGKEMVPLKTKVGTELDGYFITLDKLILAVAIFRGIANLVMTFRCCQALLRDCDRGDIIGSFDVFGIFDSMRPRALGGKGAELLETDQSSDPEDQALLPSPH